MTYLTLSAQDLLDLVVDLEQRHVHRDYYKSNDSTDHDDHDRLEDRGQSFHSGLYFILVEIRNLREHRVQGAGFLTDGHHLDDHARKCVRLVAHRRSNRSTV